MLGCTCSALSSLWLDAVIYETKSYQVCINTVQVIPNHKLTRGFDGIFNVPHSRYGFIDREDYLSVPGLKIAAESKDAGVYLVVSENKQQVYLTGHPEYDANTLDDEYNRDISQSKWLR